MHNTFQNKAALPTVALKKIKSSVTGNNLRQLAFDNAAQANIITHPGRDGKILIVNNAACKLLGYSQTELLTKSRKAIFNINENRFKLMLKQRKATGYSTALVTAIKKNGDLFPCAVTSAVFLDELGNELAITTIADISQSILKQKIIDTKNEKIVAYNIVHAISVQKKIDTKNEKVVAANIIIAISKQKRIDIKNEKIVSHNIDLAKSAQKIIDTENEKIVSDNIVLAQAKSDARQAVYNRQNKELEKKLEQEIKLKEKQITEAAEEAKDMERYEIGRELHDNVNQLLGASKLYLEMAKKGGVNSDMFLSRSCEYTLTAIEAIRKLTKGLTTDIIKNLGLCEAINNIAWNTMEVSLIKISCTLESFKEDSVGDKFKLNVYRIVQEQLNNIMKHAKATETNISLLQNNRSIMLTISDNGIGFDTDKKQHGIGLANIRSRAISYNGMAEFVSQKSQGCVLTVRFPLTGASLHNNE